MTNERHPAIDCEAVVKALWDYLDGRLPEPAMAAIAAHLHGCFGCRSHAEFESRLLALIGGTRREPTQVAALEARVRAALRASQK